MKKRNVDVDEMASSVVDVLELQLDESKPHETITGEFIVDGYPHITELRARVEELAIERGLKVECALGKLYIKARYV